LWQFPVTRSEKLSEVVAIFDGFYDISHANNSYLRFNPMVLVKRYHIPVLINCLCITSHKESGLLLTIFASNNG